MERKSRYTEDHGAHKAWPFRKKDASCHPDGCLTSCEVSSVPFGNSHYLAVCCSSSGLTSSVTHVIVSTQMSMERDCPQISGVLSSCRHHLYGAVSHES